MKMARPNLLGDKGSPAAGQSARKWLGRVGVLLLGGLLCGAAFNLWSHQQHQARLRLARNQAEALWTEVAPKVEARLAQSARHLEDLKKALGRTPAATRSEQVELTRYRVQQKQLEMQANECGAHLQRLTTFEQQAPGLFGLRPGQSALTEHQEEMLGSLLERAEKLRQDIGLLTPGFDLAREWRAQLAAAETEARLRAQAAAEALRQAELAALQRAQAETTTRAQAEARQHAPVAPLQAPLWEPATPPWMSWRLPPVRYVWLVPVRVAPPLVIGSSYPDRFFGHRYVRYYGP